jgi:Nif-specific regulatory protein
VSSSTGRGEDFLKKAEEMLRGTRWEADVRDLTDEVRRSEPAAGLGDAAAATDSDDRSQLLLRTSEILNSILSFEEVVQRTMDLAIRCLRAERGIIFLLDDKNRFVPIAQANVESQCVADAMEYSESILRRAAEDHVLWSGNAVADKRFSQYESIAAFHIKSFMCVPLKRMGKIVGTVYVDSRSLENAFEPRDVQFLRTLANQAGIAIENARLHERLRAENRELRTEIRKSIGEGRTIVGEDPKIRRVLDIVDRVADSTATVLVTGESGTGKEMIARAIHQKSARLGHPFVAMNCAAIPEALLESELFGHVKGAFTGAQANKMGKFEAADGGTLFLDEIGDMALPLQAKILRVLQEGTFEPVGGNKPRECDVRIVAATNRNLARMVQDGKFREDLFYRLNVIVLELPSLRERKSDVPMLIEHFLEKCRTAKTAVREFSPAAMALLQEHPWPGNIRELENCVLRITLLTSNPVVQPDDLRPLLEGGPRPRAASEGGDGAVGAGAAASVRSLDDLEREAIVTALGRYDGNRTAAAHALGISVRKLQYKIKEYQQAGIAIE